MLQITDNITGIKTVVSRQPRRRRRPWGSYRFPIDQRAAAAAIGVKEDGWRPKAAAGVFGVCQTYIRLARQLSDDDLVRLAHGELKLADLQRFCPAIGKDVHAVLTVDGSLRSRSHIGGTGPARVKAAVAKARKALG